MSLVNAIYIYFRQREQRKLSISAVLSSLPVCSSWIVYGQYLGGLPTIFFDTTNLKGGIRY